MWQDDLIRIREMEKEEKDPLTKKSEIYRETSKLTFVLAGEHAKWLLSTLMLINSGAIAGIFQKGAEAKYWPSVIIFSLGVLFALGSGILGWFNLQSASRYYRDTADRLLEGGGDLGMPDEVGRWRQLAIQAAMTSVGALVVGAVVFAFIAWSSRNNIPAPDRVLHVIARLGGRLGYASSNHETAIEPPKPSANP